MRTPNRTVVAAAAGIVLTAFGVTACSGGSGDSGATSAATAAAGGVDLSGVCPATIVVQTDWNPEADHGHLYEMVGPGYTVDANQKTVTGDLVAGGKPTGVKIEVRAGGPAIGFTQASAQMYTDKDITLGYVSTDEQVQLSDKFPTTAVFAENDKSPMMIMWDPTKYPDVTDIKSLGSALKDSGGVIRYFNGAAYMSYLIGSGILDKSVTDGSYDGTPANFVAAAGKDAQQGFATAEPYIYQNEVPAWGKAVKLQTIHDTGFPLYPEAMSVRTGDLATLTPCLKKLVPVMQQADVDYINDPATTNALILDLVKQYNNGWVYSQGVADFAVKQMKDLDIASNGDNAYVGDMDETRVQKIIDIMTPIYTDAGAPPKAGLKASDLYTNQFLDQTIGF
ncbi:ABC transporter substrate-binding protein [Cellulomonas sp. McL0617]|uniref:ABC transporter substrate-binding protein n=1 Tax=Cellulomonas sp. McL0617 TaxID=3415675 RepID=UPI003CEF979B